MGMDDAPAVPVLRLSLPVRPRPQLAHPLYQGAPWETRTERRARSPSDRPAGALQMPVTPDEFQAKGGHARPRGAGTQAGRRWPSGGPT
jgi:hypothetical protein